MDPDPTPFFSDFKDAKKLSYFIFFLITYQQAHYSQSKKLIFLLKYGVKILFCKVYFSQLNTLMREGKDLEPDPDPYLLILDPDPGDPKTCGSGSGSGSPTLVYCIFFE
jgi:hypothetical protein